MFHFFHLEVPEHSIPALCLLFFKKSECQGFGLYRSVVRLSYGLSYVYVLYALKMCPRPEALSSVVPVYMPYLLKKQYPFNLIPRYPVWRPQSARLHLGVGAGWGSLHCATWPSLYFWPPPCKFDDSDH